MYKKKYLKNFYIFIFILWYSTEIVFNTTLETIVGVPVKTINNVVNWLIFILLIAQIVLFQSYKKEELAIIIGITLPIIIATMLSGNRTVLSAWMLIVAMKNTDLDRIIHIAYRILLITIPMVIFFRIFGFIEDYTIMRGNLQRFSLGFAHPNQLGLRIFQLILCNCYVNRDRLGILNYCYIILAIIFTIKVPNSQTAYISLIVFLIFLLIYKYIENQKQIFMKLYTGSLLIGAVLLNIFSIILSFIDVNKYFILSQIDKWMAARFSWGHKVWQIYGTSFFGQRIYVYEEEVRLIGLTRRLWLDNAYLSLLLRYGILVFLIISISYIFLMRKMIVQKQYVLVIILFLYALYGTMESGLYQITHNIFLIAFAVLFYHKANTNGMPYEEEEHIGSAKENELSG
ncbi:MAG: hypothetical protein HDR09_14260 [Lachnospiraceae bacterium]|nr:hypothetical protein [Lachnospiraceae bacterium]